MGLFGALFSVPLIYVCFCANSLVLSLLNFYLFIFSCAESSLLRVDFSLVASSGGDSLAASSGGDSLAVSSGGDSSCSVQPSHRSGFACGTQALGCVCSIVEACWL